MPKSNKTFFKSVKVNLLAILFIYVFIYLFINFIERRFKNKNT